MRDPLVNHDRLESAIDDLGVAAIVAVSPENTFYLSSVFIRTQVTIRDRVAFVLWPAEGKATFLVCNIEESLARLEGSIADVRTYVEFADSPVKKLAEVLKDRGLDRERVGVEIDYLSAAQMRELERELPHATLVPADGTMAGVRAIKTTAEIERISAAFRLTEQAIGIAWGQAGEGDTERAIANRMAVALMDLGSEGIRHMTLSTGENTVHPHMTPGGRIVGFGDTVLTDVGAFVDGFGSDMARMGIVGAPSDRQRREYGDYRAIYVKLLHSLEPGMPASAAYRSCQADFERGGYSMGLPHVGHGVSRRGGHEVPLLHSHSEKILEPGMLLAVEPGFRPRPDQRYHLEDLVLITTRGSQVLTDWQSTAQLMPLGEASGGAYPSERGELTHADRDKC